MALLVLVAVATLVGFAPSKTSENVGGGPGTINPIPARSFLALNDTPNSYSGQSGKVVTVNGTEDGLIFATGGGGGGSILLQTNGTNNSDQTVLNLAQGNGITLTDIGAGAIGIDGVAIYTDGVFNGSQILLDLTAGAGIDLTEDGSGHVTIDNTFLPQDLQGVTNVDNKTTNDISVWDGVNITGTLKHDSGDSNGKLILTDTGGSQVMQLLPSQTFYSNGGLDSTLDWGTTSAGRNWSMPDGDGTFLLSVDGQTSDNAGNVSLTLNHVLNEGNTTTLGIDFIDGSANTRIALGSDPSLGDASFYDPADATVGSFITPYEVQGPMLRVYPDVTAPGRYATIQGTNITGSLGRTLELPNASGIIPLTVNGQSANTAGAITISTGSGTVSDFIFTDGSGFDGTVTNSTTTPTLALTTSLTTGSVPFIGASGALSQDNTNFFWDDTNNRLGIGTATPTVPLEITRSAVDTGLIATGNINSFFQANIQNTNSGASASTDWVATADNGSSTTHYIDMGINSSGGGGAPFTTANHAYLYAIDDTLNIGALGSSSQIRFFTTGGTSPVQRAVIDNAGLFGINQGTPTAKLHINTNNLGVTQADSTGILLENTQAATSVLQQYSPALTLSNFSWTTASGGSSQASKLRIDNAPIQKNTANVMGNFRVQQSNNGGAYADLFSVGGTTASGTGINMAVGGTNIFSNAGGVSTFIGAASGFGFSSSSFVSRATMDNNGIWALTPNGSIATSGTVNSWSHTASFAPTSGTAVWNEFVLAPTINQTGVTGTPITRALYINPTLTSASDFRALEIANTSGTAIFQSSTGAINSFFGDMRFDKTMTAGGTTGAQTINKNSGSVNFAAAATSLVVTNSRVTTGSNIQCTIGTNDSTMTSVQCVAGSGSFTIYPNVAPTAETRVNFFITN